MGLFPFRRTPPHRGVFFGQNWRASFQLETKSIAGSAMPTDCFHSLALFSRGMNSSPAAEPAACGFNRRRRRETKHRATAGTVQPPRRRETNSCRRETNSLNCLIRSLRIPGTTTDGGSKERTVQQQQNKRPPRNQPLNCLIRGLRIQPSPPANPTASQRMEQFNSNRTNDGHRGTKSLNCSIRTKRLPLRNPLSCSICSLRIPGTATAESTALRTV